MNRRQFLCSASAAAFAGTVVRGFARPSSDAYKISRIEIFPVYYGMTGYFKFFSGASGTQGRAAILIKVTADNGVSGWGQVVPIPKWTYETIETASITLLKYFIPALIGHDPTDIAGALALLDKVIAPAFSTGMPLTRAGIDIALHDLTGKLHNKSLNELWGRPTMEKLTLSWTVNVTTLDDVTRVMDEGRKRGYKNFNIKIAPDPDFDVKLAKAVRTGASEGFLWADANCGYSLEQATRAIPQLADAGVDVIEAPIRPNHLSGYQKLKQLSSVPILMDEGVVSPVELEEFIKLDMMDGMAMKPARCGGLLSNKRQIELCEKAGLMWLGSGLTDPDISFAALLGLYGAYGLKKPAALNGPQFLTDQVLVNPIRVEDGEVHIPHGPGLGIEVDESKVTDLMKKSGGDKLLGSLSV